MPLLHLRKTTPELRHKLDKAILNYEPAGKRRIAAEFERVRELVYAQGSNAAIFPRSAFSCEPLPSRRRRGALVVVLAVLFEMI